MSQRDRVVLHSLAELGGAMRPPRPPAAPPALMPLGDRPRCACGKVSYPDRRTAERAARELRSALSVYACPLGNRAYHLQGRGRSRRERSGAG